MNRILVAGLALELGDWLEKRLGDVVCCTTQSEAEALSEAGSGAYSMLVVDDRFPNLSDILRRFRSTSNREVAPILCCVNKSSAADVPRRLVNEFGVEQFLFHPLDREDVAIQIAATLQLTLAEPGYRQCDANNDMVDAIAAVWEQFRESMVAGLDVIDRAIAAATTGGLDHLLRRSATAEAHKLAGSIGTSGGDKGSEQAHEIERVFRSGANLTEPDISRLGQLSHALRQQLSRPPSTSPSNPVADEVTEDRMSQLLIVDSDRKLSEALANEAAVQGIHPEQASDLATARGKLLHQRPDVVVLDPAFPSGVAEGLAFLAKLARDEPPVPVLVLTGPETPTGRVEVARLGGQGFLQKPQSPAHVIQGVAETLQRLRASEATVLAVDDDPQVLATLRTWLTSATVRVRTINDPLRFWDALEHNIPDLVILDVDMPHISGIELCRVIRSEPRWNAMPVVFLTAHTDPKIVHRIFAAGADDYVCKPIVGPELVTRIKNRLERIQLQRKLAETDSLTGVANRHKASQILDDYLRSAERDREPVGLTVVDVDRFKQVNDRHGHLVGDEVLRRVAKLLTKRFRCEDVVARWGGEEFVVGMYGMTRDNAVRRMNDVLDELRSDSFTGAENVEFQVTFSAGVAAFPDDGQTVQVLFQAADAALYRAKEAGRNRVLSTELPTPDLIVA